MTTHNYAEHSYAVTDRTYQRPEGALIERARLKIPLSGNKAAKAAGISSARWRQIENGYHLPGAGQVIPVLGPPETVARMARVVGVTPEQLRGADRPDAADALDALIALEAETEIENESTPLRLLLRIREDVDRVIAELRRT